VPAEPKVLVITGDGLNCERETAHAFRLAGAEPQLVHIADILGGERSLEEFQILALIGGFSNGDHLGAGTVQAVRFRYRLREPLQRFVAAGRPVIGICNGFQTLVKMGILPNCVSKAKPDCVSKAKPNCVSKAKPNCVSKAKPGCGSKAKPGRGEPGRSRPGSRGPARAAGRGDAGPAGGAAWEREATIMPNDSGRFEDRWVQLAVDPGSPCLWTRGLRRLYLPVRHGEGKFVARDAELLRKLRRSRQIVLRYADEGGRPTLRYPANPNGSAQAVAGICDPSGLVFGLMPHPEAYHSPFNHPAWTRDAALGRPLPQEGQGVALFRNAVQFVRGRAAEAGA
jgi:phosphoribosylformylglycinamidine synthase